MSRALPVGATLGVLGGGQLGRLFALAARRLGYRVAVLTPEAESPAAQVADWTVCAPYGDLDAVAHFARRVAAVTYEFEHIPIRAARRAAQFAPVRPDPQVLWTCQDRVREKQFLAARGLPTVAFRHVQSAAELDAALRDWGAAAVLKTRAGYDGKGQVRVEPVAASAALAGADRAPGPRAVAADAWAALGAPDAIVERWIDLAAEFSVIVARDATGAVATYGPIGNVHAHHVLDTSVFPAPLSPRVAAAALDLAHAIAAALDVVGVIGVEFFLTRTGGVLVNELAPRPYNSGHLTDVAHAASQFEQQARVLAGLPLGAAHPLAPAALANLLGELWCDGPPDWTALDAADDVALCLYGKATPRPGRKMGHLTARAATAAAALQRVCAARAALRPHMGAPRRAANR